MGRNEAPGLKVKLQGKLDNAMPLLLRCRSEDRIRLLAVDVERRLQVRRPADERPQRMIEEIVRVEAELNFLRFRDHEIFE